MSAGTVTANGIEIWYEDFGDPADPHVMLVMGANTTAMWWDSAFYEPIVEAGFHVVRFDNRDVGLSEWFDFAAQPYTLADMAADTIGLMDALSIPKSHLVGASMGGMVAQTVALNHPDRVLTLTSICSSPDAFDPDLPTTPEHIVELAMAPMPDSREGRLDRLVEFWQSCAGTTFAFDEPHWRAVFETDLDRGFNPTPGHGFAIAMSPSRREALRDLDMPVLVIHGDADPVLPHAHGVATAEAIPGAMLVTIPGAGHTDVLVALDEVLPPILNNLDSAE